VDAQTKSSSVSTGLLIDEKPNRRVPASRTKRWLDGKESSIATVLVCGASLLWSYIYISYFNGDFYTVRLLPWVPEYPYSYMLAKAIIVTIGLSIPFFATCVFDEELTLSIPKIAFLSGAHVGYLAAIASGYWCIVVGGAMLLYLAYRLLLPVLGRWVNKDFCGFQCSAYFWVAFLLIALALIPPTSTSWKWDVPAGTSEHQYYTTPVTYVDEAQFLADLSVIETEWGRLDSVGRIEKLALVAQYECTNVLGCPTPQIAVADLGDGTLGVFRSGNYTISVDEEFLISSSFDTVLGTVLHESRHAYQHQCSLMVAEIAETHPEHLNLTVLRSTADLAEAELNFDGGYYENAIAAYYNNPYEKDAFTYEYLRLHDYYLEKLGLFPDGYNYGFYESLVTDSDDAQ
jgi:hypothetical protein